MQKHSSINVLHIKNYANDVSPCILALVDIIIAKGKRQVFSRSNLFITEYLNLYASLYIDTAWNNQIISDLNTPLNLNIDGNYNDLLHDSVFSYYIEPTITEINFNINISDYKKISQTAVGNNYFYFFESENSFFLIHIINES
jgi:hypothetical protein